MKLLLLSIARLNKMTTWNFAQRTLDFSSKPLRNALFTEEVIAAKKGYWIKYWLQTYWAADSYHMITRFGFSVRFRWRSAIRSAAVTFIKKQERYWKRIYVVPEDVVGKRFESFRDNWSSHRMSSSGVTDLVPSQSTSDSISFLTTVIMSIWWVWCDRLWNIKEQGDFWWNFWSTVCVLRAIQ